jgi:ferredoxin
MATVANKLKENVAGAFYVDDACIDCDLCRQAAPNNFKRLDDAGYSIVFKQPDTPEETAQCQQAKGACPVEAIGDDGG